MPIPYDSWGRSPDDYVRSAIFQAKDDAINLGQIAFWGRSHFKLEEHELLEFVEKIVLALLEAGASIVRSVQEEGRYEWEVASNYRLQDRQEIVRLLVKDSEFFHTDHDFIAWFSFNARKSSR